jgi:hypothetical protein
MALNHGQAAALDAATAITATQHRDRDADA